MNTIDALPKQTIVNDLFVKNKISSTKILFCSGLLINLPPIMNGVRNVYLSLGSNSGDRLFYLQQAMDAVAHHVGELKKTASVYKTAAWGFEGDYFYNSCIELETALPAAVLMQNLLKIEAVLGRRRNFDESYQSRTIDIDILLIEGEIIFNESLQVPHPRMLERRFVLQPLAEIAPGLIYPQKGTITTCLENCMDTTDVLKTDSKLYSKCLTTLKHTIT